MLKDKDVAWNEIQKYNLSTLIYHEIIYLKRKNDDMKSLRSINERKSIMATGPQEATVDIDPDIARIAPHLMKSAVLFMSNISEKEVNDKREFVFEMISMDQSIEILSDHRR
ncbi:hypothetical protein ACFW04_011823 [Cataglyphis niger]